MKIDVNLTTSIKEILRKVNHKLNMSYPDLVFDPEIKILKVKNLRYIIKTIYLIQKFNLVII